MSREQAEADYRQEVADLDEAVADAVAEMAAKLSRHEKAEEIMVRRHWFTRLCRTVDGVQQWTTYNSQRQDVSFVRLPGGGRSDIAGKLVRPTPTEAILAAEEWWTANIKD